MREHGIGANDTTIGDACVSEDCRIGTDPDILLERDRACDTGSLTHGDIGDVMIMADCRKDDMGGDVAIWAYG